MAARWDRRLFLGATALLGATLLVAGLVLQAGDSRRRAAPPPEPAWRTTDRRAAYFEKQLRPVSAGDGVAVARVSGALRAVKFLDCTGDSIHMRMTRSLNSGHEFDSEMVWTCRAAEAGHEVEMDMTRGSQEPLRLRMMVRVGAIARVETGTGMPPVWQPWTAAQALPLALGDLPVSEVLELAHACTRDQFKMMGFLGGLGARPQAVLEASLAQTAQDSASTAAARVEKPAAGERALAYVDSATSELRSVRVFDAKGYLVRLYDGLVWTTTDSGARLSELQVTSVPNASHSVFHRLPAERPR